LPLYQYRYRNGYCKQNVIWGQLKGENVLVYRQYRKGREKETYVPVGKEMVHDGVLRRWIDECPHKGVGLNDGVCTINKVR